MLPRRTLARQRPIIGDASQRGKMATLLTTLFNSLFFVLNMFCLPIYTVSTIMIIL